MTTKSATKHTPIIAHGKDRYGHFLMIDGFRSAMPSGEVAQMLAAAPVLLEALNAVVALIDADARITTSQYVTKARAAIAKARGA